MVIPIRSSLPRIALVSSGLLFLLLFFSRYLELISIFVLLVQIITPVFVSNKFNLSLKFFSIYAHNIDSILDLRPRINYHTLKQDTQELIKSTIFYLLPYFILLIIFLYPSNFYFKFSLPDNFLFLIISQIFLIALPEEIFYRGFLQTCLYQKYPKHICVFGIYLGPAVIITNLIFALGHIIGNYSPIRLLTFFPGLVFSRLVIKNNSIFSATLFHALCNISSQLVLGNIYWVAN